MRGLSARMVTRAVIAAVPTTAAADTPPQYDLVSPRVQVGGPGDNAAWESAAVVGATADPGAVHHLA